MKTLVTNAEIEEVGQNLIRFFIGNREPPPNCIDIEGFIEDYLHLPIVYARIAEKDRDKLGFVSDGKYPLAVFEGGKKVSIVYPAGTIVIDRYLLRADKSAQRRFTLAHEAAHVIFERMSPTAAGPRFNRYFDREHEYSVAELREHFNLCETQTDRLASVLLMPEFLVIRTLCNFRDGTFVRLYGDNVMSSEDKLSVQKMADCLGVSFSALRIRLKELGLVDYRDMSEYFATEMAF